jgi:hypothetical protein
MANWSHPQLYGKQWTTQEMPTHPEWHHDLCCHDREHPKLSQEQGMTVTVPEAWQQTLDLNLKSTSGRIPVTVASLHELAGKNKNKQIGGALFSNPAKWCKICPNTRSARWQVLGGVDFRLRKIPQQRADQTHPKQVDDEERGHTATKMEELVDEHGVYEDVPVTEAEEEAARRAVWDGSWEKALKGSRQCSHIWASEQSQVIVEKERPLSTAQVAAQVILKDKESQLTGKKRKREEDYSLEQAQEDLQTKIHAQVVYSPCFTLEKPDKKRRRLLHNLKISGANAAVHTNKHKQDGPKQLRGMVRPGDRFIGWDFREAFHQLMVQLRYRALLRTKIWMRKKKGAKEWYLRRLQNRTLSQGFCASPEIMTKMVMDLIRVWRGLGIRCAIKIDDLIAVVSSIQEGLMVAYVITKTLIDLGAILSEEKCDFGLSTRAKWCGMVFCSIAQVTSLPEDKVTKMVTMTQLFKDKLLAREEGAQVVTLREVQRITGTLVSAIDGVEAVRLMVLEISELRKWLSKHTKMDWDAEVDLTTVPADLITATVLEIEEWTRDYDVENPERIEWNGKLIYSDPPIAVIFTDACSRAGGVWVEGDSDHPLIDVSFPFTGSEIHEHITLQETAAAADGIFHVLEERNYSMCTVAVKVDATAAIKYVRSNGGKKAKLAKRVWEMMKCARRRRVHLGADKDFDEWHVQGSKNPSDAPSRKAMGMSEWKMNQVVFSWMNTHWGPVGLDAFAAAWNTQSPRYLCRQLWDGNAQGYDALMYPYQAETEVVWAFPPPHRDLTVKFLRAVETVAVEVIVILPMWKTDQLVTALRMATKMPILLECTESLLEAPEAYVAHQEMPEFQVWKQERQWWTKKTFKCLIGVRLSGDANKRGAFLSEWQIMLSSCTKKDQMARGAAIMIDHSLECLPGSRKKMEESALTLSQMLCSLT